MCDESPVLAITSLRGRGNCIGVPAYAYGVIVMLMVRMLLEAEREGRMAVP